MAVIFDRRTPAWPVLRLERHLAVMKSALAVYVPLVVGFWLHVARVWHMGPTALNVYAWALGLTYLVAIGEAIYVQKTMHDAAVYKHGPSHIIVGAILLNPCALGWWMPVSVLLAARRVKEELEAFAAKRQPEASVAQPDELSVRGADRSWRDLIRPALPGLALLLLLGLAWHFAQIPRPR